MLVRLVIQIPQLDGCAIGGAQRFRGLYEPPEMGWSRHVGDGEKGYAAGKVSCAVLQPIRPRLTSRDCANTFHLPRLRYVASVKPLFALPDSTAAMESRLLPHLEFCPNVEAQILTVGAGDDSFAWKAGSALRDNRPIAYSSRSS